MVIAIDESGTFNFERDKHKRHLFLAAFIQSENGALQIKKDQFLDWENSLPESVKDNKGEVKGNLLLKPQFSSFLKTVILSQPLVKFHYVSVIPQALGKPLLSKHMDLELRLLKYMADKAPDMGFSKKKMNFFIEYEKWLNNRNESEFLKMFCLKHCLYNSLGNIAPYAALFDLDSESHNISFKVDKAFLSNENIYWKQYAIHSIQEYSKISPFPIIDTWTNSHPFFEKYIIRDNSVQGLNLKKFFTESFDFVDSATNFEIRIADLLAIILNRLWNSSHDYKELADIMSRQKVTRNYHTELRLNDFDEERKYIEFTTT